jgi:uncharacterized membrane protein YfcA
MSPDAANAMLEAAWVLVLSLSTRRMWLDRDLKGVSIGHVVMTVLSSWWFIYYYAHLDQWWSFAAALGYAAAVGAWTASICYHARRRR